MPAQIDLLALLLTSDVHQELPTQQFKQEGFTITARKNDG